MNKVISISLGSSSRDFDQIVKVNGIPLMVSRLGVNGSQKMALTLFRKYDGKIPFMGLGGANFYYHWGNQMYSCADGMRIAHSTCRSVVLDGSRVKRALDWQAFKLLESITNLSDNKVLIVSALDRPHLVDFTEKKAQSILIGDAIFALRLPIPFYSKRLFGWAVTVTMPFLRHIPLKLLYPTGKKQDEIRENYLTNFFTQTGIICGDFHLLRRILPSTLEGKILLTTTVTEQDLMILKERGLKAIITSTPYLNGRALGANVWETILCTLENKIIKEASMPEVLVKYNIMPSLKMLN